MLVKAKHWIAETFREDSRPDMQTVRKLVEDEKLAGCIIGSTVFIELENGITTTYIHKKIEKIKPKYNLIK